LTIGLPYIRLWERLRESERLRGRNVFLGLDVAGHRNQQGLKG